MIQRDENGLNLLIDAAILPELEMRRLGFSPEGLESWYISFRVEERTILHLTIPKDGKRLRIEVKDEWTRSICDYQGELESAPESEFSLGVKRFVEEKLQALTDAGVITGFTRGMRI